MNIGVTGHRSLPDNDWSWVDDEIGAFLRDRGRPIAAWSSLAPGADQHFALIALALGADLHVVIPFDSYEATLTEKVDREMFQRLMNSASEIEVLQTSGNFDQDYYAAGKHIVRNCDGLVAVWDGKQSRGLGGTADIVSFARHLHKPVHWLNPSTRRSSTL